MVIRETKENRFTDNRKFMLGVLYKFILILSFGSACDVSAQCISDVQPTKDKEIAYKSRGTRCEGLFSQKVSGSINLNLIGYHSQLLKGGISEENMVVKILGRDSAYQPVLQARSARPRLNYLMDTKDLNQAGQFIWPTDILKHPKISLKLHELAMLASQEQKEDSISTLVYLPVEIENVEPALIKGLFISLIADTELKEIYLTAKQKGKLIFEEVPHGLGYYPPLRAIHIPLIGFSDGLAQIAIIGVSHNGASSKLSFNLVIPKSSD